MQTHRFELDDGQEYTVSYDDAFEEYFVSGPNLSMVMGAPVARAVASFVRSMDNDPVVVDSRAVNTTPEEFPVGLRVVYYPDAHLGRIYTDDGALLFETPASGSASTVMTFARRLRTVLEEAGE